MADLLREQLDLCHRLGRVLTNLRKKGAANITSGLVQSRIDALESLWTVIQQNHRELKRNATAEMLVEQEYFRENHFDIAEESFLDQRGVLFDHLKKLEARQAPADNAGKTSAEETGARARTLLPRIELPKFDGQFKEWTTFHDTFDSLVIQDSTLKEVDRFHYLKSCLKGDAAMLINNIPITEANFKRAWTKLTERFENKRFLVSSQITALTNVPTVKRESASELKHLLYATWDVIGALEELGRPVTNATDWIVHITVEKLDSRSRREWDISLGASREPPSLDALKEFLETRVHTVEAWEQRKASEATDAKKPVKGAPKVHQVASNRSPAKSCDLCDKEHYLLYCPLFRKKSPTERRSVLVDHHRCLNCLGKHPTYDCSSAKRCQLCSEKHHSCIHEASAAGGAAVQHVTPSCDSTRVVLLGLARVHVLGPVSQRITVRALIDPGSEVSLITERVVVSLGLSKEPARVPLSFAGGTARKTTKGRVRTVISSIHDPKESLPLTALILAKLSDYTPNCRPSMQPWQGLDGMRWADPFLLDIDPVDLLLGADVYSQLLLEGVLRRGPDLPVAQETRLGWILTGSISSATGLPASRRSPTVQLCTSTTDLACLLQRFWEQEELTIKAPLTPTERECEDHFLTTCRRTSEGRFEVRLPFKEPPVLGPSRSIALRTLESMERRCQRSEEFRSLYQSFMEEYLKLGHMAVARDSPSHDCYYLPHHGVLRPSSSTTKLRVVFNGSMPTNNGKSLNDFLHAGPNLLPALPDILLRWRMHPVVLVADVEKMFRQVIVHPEDRDFQRILWRPRPGAKLREFKLNTVTYGLTCSPYLAQRCLRQLAQDEEHRFPGAARVLINDVYMDDVLSGAASLSEAVELKAELELLCRAGGFTLHKWASNAPEFDAANHSCSPEPRHWDTGSQHSVLGIKWAPEIDCFQIRIQDEATVATPTKRSVLRQAAQIFDPLGWLSPATIVAKIFFQSLWLLKTDWDDPLPTHEETRWKTFLEGLPALRSIKLPRWLGVTSDCLAVEIHGFCDASERAYAAVVYLRVEDTRKRVTTKLLSAKTKVAPLKQVSLPRLELCGAHLLARLVSHLQEALDLKPKPVHLWCDSRVVLGWVKAHPNRWQTYVANRVADIQRLQPTACWRHVKGQENPADIASRGIPSAALLEHPLWWNGPPWLTQRAIWPNQDATTATALPEERHPVHHVREQPLDEVSELLKRFSNLRRLLRVTAWCRRWLRSHQGHRSSPLTAKDLDEADKRLVRWVQRTAFPKEMSCLQEGLQIPTKSRLLRLNPFLDELGILRVGGRLQMADLHYEQRHPMIIPDDSPLAALRIREEHLRCLHGGTQLTLATLRRRYWILRGRQVVKAVINRCLTCVRWRGTTAQQLMGPLPSARVVACRPFLRVGVDYAGPFSLRSFAGRGHRTTKGYIALFICLSTRAVHLEVVSDGTTDCFLAALRRVVARRGLCVQIFSDCGTVFLGANRELKHLLGSISPNNRYLLDNVAAMGIEWQFNPPSAPHFGGIWEAAVKSTKHHLRRVIGEQTLTFEEFSTLLAQVEACLNSRPLQYLSDDPQDLEALSPGHFIIGTALTAVPEPGLGEIPSSRLSRWQLLQQLQQSFWRRWSKDYLNTLQTRGKWCSPKPMLREGDLCLIKSELLPPTRWPLARIIKAHPGPDGLPRVVTLRTAASECIRPIHRLIPLPPTRIDETATKPAPLKDA